MGEMAIKGLEGGSGGGGGGGDPASSAEMKNIISILRADRANIDRLTKEMGISKEQLAVLEEKSDQLKGDIAQKVGVRDVQVFAQKHDMEEIVANCFGSSHQSLSHPRQTLLDQGQAQSRFRSVPCQ